VRKHLIRAAAIGALALLAACGTNEKERTTGGAGSGALAGAAVGAIAGPPGAAIGAAVGAGAGAVTGATTKPSDLNLGQPPWSNPNARVPGPNGVVQGSTGNVTKPY
jgi:phage tail tape-measure protein